MSEWLMRAIITFSLGITAALLLYILIRVWMFVFDVVLRTLKIHKSFIQWVYETHHPKMAVNPKKKDAKDRVIDILIAFVSFGAGYSLFSLIFESLF